MESVPDLAISTRGRKTAHLGLRPMLDIEVQQLLKSCLQLVAITTTISQDTIDNLRIVCRLNVLLQKLAKSLPLFVLNVELLETL